MVRKFGSGAAALTVVFALAGCGSSGGKPNYSTNPPVSASSTPSAPPSSSASGTASAAPTSTPATPPPTEPDIAMQNNSEGALAFAAYFIKVLDWSIANTDPTPLQKISADSCTTCSGYVRQLSDLRSSGGHVQGGAIRLESAAVVTGTGDVPADAVVQVRTVQQPDTIIRPGRSPEPESTTVARNHSYLFLGWRDSKWRVLEIEGKS